MADKVVYPAVFEYADGVIGVSFPDLPGCVTSAETDEDAMEQAREAMLFHLEGMIDDDEILPAASKLRDLKLGKGESATLIDVPRPDKLERVNFTVPSSKLFVIDKLAEEFGMTRSAYLIHRAIEFEDRSGIFTTVGTKLGRGTKHANPARYMEGKGRDPAVPIVPGAFSPNTMAAGRFVTTADDGRGKPKGSGKGK